MTNFGIKFTKNDNSYIREMGYGLFMSHSTFKTFWNDVFKTENVK